MMSINQINQRLTELEETKTEEAEKEVSFLYDQLWEIKAIAEEVNGAQLETMNATSGRRNR